MNLTQKRRDVFHNENSKSHLNHSKQQYTTSQEKLRRKKDSQTLVWVRNIPSCSSKKKGIPEAGVSLIRITEANVDRTKVTYSYD